MARDTTHDNLRPRIVILTPVCNEKDTLPDFAATVTKVLLSSVEYDFKVLFIDDGSTDSSWDIIRMICGADRRFTGIRLSRNYGSDIALAAGFAHADGDAAAVLPCDLQDPPEVILEFLKQWKAGAKIVWGARKLDKDKFPLRIVNRYFYSIMRRYSLPRGSAPGTGSFFLADKSVVDCFRRFPERNRVTYALIAHTGFEQASVTYERISRAAGSSKWTFAKKYKAFCDAFLGYSILPIRIISLIGAGGIILASLLAVFILYRFLSGNRPDTYVFIASGIIFLTGVQFLLTGFIGEYLYRIYIEAAARPLYFISDSTDDAVLLRTDAHMNEGFLTHDG